MYQYLCCIYMTECNVLIFILFVGYKNKILLRAVHVAGVCDDLVDKLSRVVLHPTEWSLDNLIVGNW